MKVLVHRCFQPGGAPSRGLLSDCRTSCSLREPFFEALVAWHRNWDKGAHKMYATQTQTFLLFSVICNSKIIFDTKSSNSRKSRHCPSNGTKSKVQICWLRPKFKTCGLVELSIFIATHTRKNVWDTICFTPGRGVSVRRGEAALSPGYRGAEEKNEKIN